MVTKPEFAGIKLLSNNSANSTGAYMRKNCPRIHDGEKGNRFDKMLQDQVWY